MAMILTLEQWKALHGRSIAAVQKPTSSCAQGFDVACRWLVVLLVVVSNDNPGVSRPLTLWIRSLYDRAKLETCGMTVIRFRDAHVHCCRQLVCKQPGHQLHVVVA
jgi:hypothetical protein